MSVIKEKCFVCDTEIIISVDVLMNGPIMGGPEHEALVARYLRRYKTASADEVRRVLEQILYDIGTAQLREVVDGKS
jgi:hypothetical protein